MGIDPERAARLDLAPSPWNADTPADEPKMVDGFMWRAWTDGSVEPNPGAGGWAAIIIAPDGTRQELSGAEPATTNNKMELAAILAAVKAVPEGEAATIYTDSLLSVRVLTRRWKAKKNRDFVQAIWQAAKSRRVKFQWVRGHAGNHWNERADQLAGQARMGRRG